MDSLQAERWAATRARGRAAFIWRYGVLFWGLTTGALWAIAMAASQGWGSLPILLALALVLFPAGGYFFGAWLWNTMEKLHQRSGEGPRPTR